MDSKPDRVRLPVALLAVALSAAAWWLGSGTHPLWWVTWLAPLPVLWLAPRVRALWAALAALTAYGVGGFNTWSYLHGNIGLPVSIILYFVLAVGLVMMACALLYRRLLLRGQAVAAAVSVPSLWVAYEYINSLVSPHATFFNISYTQASVLPVIQLVAVTGIWGVGFLIVFVPTAVSLQFWPKAMPARRRFIAVMAGVAMLASLAYGTWRLQAPPSSTVRVGLVSLNERGMPQLTSEEGKAREAAYIDALSHLVDQGAQVVLIPETRFATTTTDMPAFAAMATQRKVTVGVGIGYLGASGGDRNMLAVFEPGASSPATYSKHHLLLGLEQFSPGNTYTLLNGTPRIGLAICKDMDFQDIGRGYADLHAQLLLVPASDFDVDGWLHSRMAVVRGIESGFAVARAARAGRLTLSDDRGRVIAEASSEQRSASVIGDLPLHETVTLYTRWGDWFAWLNLAALACVLGMAFRPR